MDALTKTSVKSVVWFASPPPLPGKWSIGSALGKLAVGLGVSLFLYITHHLPLAIVVLAVGGLLFLVSIVSPKSQAAIDFALARFGRLIGTVVGGIVLSVLYLVVLTPARFFGRITGADELHLRDHARQSYWLLCDTDSRKTRFAGSMFATEVQTKRGSALSRGLLTILLLLGISEGVLRFTGYGEPVTYVADPIVGYYPQPNLTIRRSGGLVHTNQFGMRSRDIEAKKAPGVFRILLLGDSTLYGGSYIDQKDLYSRRLEDSLNQRNLSGKVEVLAMGANGWGPFHEHGFVNRFGLLDADLVIINLPMDDVNRPLYGLMSVPFSASQTPPKLALEEVINHFMWSYRSSHAGLDEAWEAQQSKIGVREYANLVDDLQKRGVEVLVAILPGRGPGLGGAEYPHEAKWRQSLEEQIRALGAPIYFPKGLFFGKGTTSELYHDDVHLQTKGHHLYADFLADRITDDSQRFRLFSAKEAR